MNSSEFENRSKTSSEAPPHHRRRRRRRRRRHGNGAGVPHPSGACPPGAVSPAIERDRRGILFVLSAASGTGKTTLIQRALGQINQLRLSVSYTTRPARQGETHGQHYFFVAYHEFNAMIRRGEFLEWAEVYGERYGTSKVQVEESLAKGQDVLLEIDVQGAAKVRELFPDSCQIFLLPPSSQELEQRIRGRGRDSEADIQKRLEQARAEIAQAPNYDYLIVNDQLEAAVRQFVAVVQAERQRLPRQRHLLARWGVALEEGGKRGGSLIKRLLRL